MALELAFQEGLEPSEGGGSPVGGAAKSRILDGIRLDQDVDPFVQEGQRPTAFSHGALAPGEWGGLQVGLRLAQEGRDGLHAGDGCRQALGQRSEIGQEQGDQAEDGLAGIGAGVGALEMIGLEFPKLDLQEALRQAAIDTLGGGQRFIRQGAQAVEQALHLGQGLIHAGRGVIRQGVVVLVNADESGVDRAAPVVGAEEIVQPGVKERR